MPTIHKVEIKIVGQHFDCFLGKKCYKMCIILALSINAKVVDQVEILAMWEFVTSFH
jgi:hypothetical protein